MTRHEESEETVSPSRARRTTTTVVFPGSSRRHRRSPRGIIVNDLTSIDATGVEGRDADDPTVEDARREASRNNAAIMQTVEIVAGETTNEDDGRERKSECRIATEEKDEIVRGRAYVTYVRCVPCVTTRTGVGIYQNEGAKNKMPSAIS